MPRSKSSVKLSTDDLRNFIAGENGEIRQKMIEWARSELARREAAGRGRQLSRKEANQTEVHYDSNPDFGA